MKLLIARFGLFLVMLMGIAGMRYAQGGGDQAGYVRASAECGDEVVALASSETLPATRKERGPGQRLIRWQSLLPGAFR